MPEKAGQLFLPAEDGPLSHWAISQVVEEPLHSGMQLVFLLGANTGASVQELPVMEATEKDLVGGGAESNGEGGTASRSGICLQMSGVPS
jgi:hypothetical protein